MGVDNAVCFGTNDVMGRLDWPARVWPAACVGLGTSAGYTCWFLDYRRSVLQWWSLASRTGTGTCIRTNYDRGRCLLGSRVGGNAIANSS